MGLLFSVQLCGYLIPILEIPVLARALGVQEYGKVVLIQSVALLTSLVVEYGFSLSGSRQVAIARDDSGALARIFGEVLSAKLLIFSIVSIVGVVIFLTSGPVFYDRDLLLMGWVYFIAFGFSPFWFFQGLEKIALVVVVEVSLRFVGLFFLYIFIHGEQDALLAFGIMSGFGFLNTLFGNAICVNKIRKFSLSFAGGLQQIKLGFHVFVYKSSNNILMSAGPSLVGVTSGHVAVAAYVPAEKIIRGFVSFVNPILIGFYPYLNRQFQVSQGNTMRLSWMIVIGMFFSGVLSAGLIYFVGDFLILTVLGAGFTAASEILKVFVWIIPFRLANQALGLCMLIPMGRDKATSFFMMFSSIMSMLLAALMSIWYSVEGVVLGFVIAEVFLSVALISVVFEGRDKYRNKEGV
ncbi:hypothetical protein C1Y35_09825 [Pseudomonas sp. GW456-L14]|nr:hypothetical protein C1Y35_09825 [Pseudomonas sp. GW456-L14]PMY57997.1 hypothetical protein C1Y34_05690 [Pseudomonas sp. GW456-L12]